MPGEQNLRRHQPLYRLAGWGGMCRQNRCRMKMPQIMRLHHQSMPQPPMQRRRLLQMKNRRQPNRMRICPGYNGDTLRCRNCWPRPVRNTVWPIKRQQIYSCTSSCFSFCSRADNPHTINIVQRLCLSMRNAVFFLCGMLMIFLYFYLIF